MRLLRLDMAFEIDYVINVYKYNLEECIVSIADMRKQVNLSQREFADLFDIPVRTIQQWEQGRSCPPDYVVSMVEALLPQKMAQCRNSARHSIPEKTRWRVCIADPFENCSRIYPLQQWKVRELLDDIIASVSVRSVTVFGSSITQRCHIGSDVDLYVDTDSEGAIVREAHDFPFDLWTPHTVDEKLGREIQDTGVRVYG